MACICHKHDCGLCSSSGLVKQAIKVPSAKPSSITHGHGCMMKSSTWHLQLRGRCRMPALFGPTPCQKSRQKQLLTRMGLIPSRAVKAMMKKATKLT
eukprot:2812837-Amphidinium_carterae.1